MIQTRKARLLDVVELLEDLPEYGVKKGDRGAVVEVFDHPEEAYMIEFVDESGTSSRIADWVKPEQIRSTDEIVRTEYEKGMSLLNEGRISDAEEAFRQAVELSPECLVNLHNSILEFHKAASNGLGSIEELFSLVEWLRFVLRINSSFQIARHNLAVVYLNYGFQSALREDFDTALNFYRLALGIDAPPEFVSCLKNNIGSAYTMLSIRAQQDKDFEKALLYSIKACEANADKVTRHNLGVSYANLGWDYLNREDNEKALDLLKRALDTGLSVPQLFNNYGAALANLGIVDEAIKAFEKAIELSPEDNTAIGNLQTMQKVKKGLTKLKDITTKVADIIPISSIQPYQAAA